MKFHIQCAWCGRSLGTREGDAPRDNLSAVSHAICPACSTDLLNELESLQPTRSRFADAGAKQPTT